MSRLIRSFGLFKNISTRAATTSSVAPQLHSTQPPSEGDPQLPFHNSVVYKLDDLKVQISETPTSSKKWEISIPGKEHPIKFKTKHDAVHFAIFQGWEFQISMKNK